MNARQMVQIVIDERHLLCHKSSLAMQRKSFLKLTAALPLAFAAMKLKDFGQLANTLEPSDTMPLLFIGHGNPMNAITDNEWRRSWVELGQKLSPPKAILVISAHWLTRGTHVTMNERPETIHDFGGFPQELFQQEYPAPGAVDYAKMVIEGVESVPVHESYEWGLDHGTWSVLKPMFPEAKIPVFQLSIDYYKPIQYHYDLARELAFLRSKGVLIIGSGNVVHNLRAIAPNHPTLDWAAEFDAFVKEKIENKDHQALVDYQQAGKLAQLAHPTNDHYLPLLYVLGLRNEKDNLEFFNETFDMGSISMRSMIFN